MAGNIVKSWWRQWKQYKQFSVLQECQTDSEELIQQVPQAPYSVPPKPQSTNKQNKTAPLAAFVDDQEIQQKSENLLRENLAKEKLQKRHSIATTRHLEVADENRVQLDGFTCDVSLEDSSRLKAQPPIQFSFTLYDVDGCGKITKDDIAGIVSTIYENIGNTVVVPHYGKKTINVKLTVSPDSKNKQKASTDEQIYQNLASKKLQSASKRRYRPRALLSDDEVDDEGSECMSENLTPLTRVQKERTASFKKKSENLTIDKNNVYESINNLKSSHQSKGIENLISTRNIKSIELCKSCKPNQLNHINGNAEFEDKQPKLSARKKVLRKSKSKRQRPSEARVRSLSVGNDHKLRKQQEKELSQEPIEDFQLSKSNNMRRNELIEIIKDSLEKNCFQTKRKTENIGGVTPIRQRSNTVACADNKLMAEKVNCLEHDQQHLCAFDSFLHATICSNAHMPSDPAKILSAKMNNRSKTKQTPPASKLKTSVLNQLNPNLTPEQKLTRKLNDVEKWLLERESNKCKIFNEGKARLRENKNLLNPVAVDKLTAPQISNKDLQISKKLRHSEHQSKQQKEILNTSRNQKMFAGDFECENLLNSDEDQEPSSETVDKKVEEKLEAASSDSVSSHVLRNVIVHHIHHFYHFDEKE